MRGKSNTGGFTNLELDMDHGGIGRIRSNVLDTSKAVLGLDGSLVEIQQRVARELEDALLPATTRVDLGDAVLVYQRRGIERCSKDVLDELVAVLGTRAYIATERRILRGTMLLEGGARLLLTQKHTNTHI